MQPLDASAVRLLPGSPFHDRQELHRTGYLASYEPDRLLSPYRRLAKLPEPAGTKPYPGWEQGFIKGHMVGHWLSAASRMAVATGDDSYRTKVRAVVAGLAECQKALDQGGYLAAFPMLAFDHMEGRSKDGGGVLVPYYTYHKTLAGLLDAHRYLGDARALQVARGMSEWVERRLASLTPAQIEAAFRTDRRRNPLNEFGGMSDALTALAEATGEDRWLAVAKTFNRPWLVDPLVAGENRLRGLHANTHVAQMVGIARHGLRTGDDKEMAAARRFWSFVAGPHAFAIGGNSFKEWFDSPGVEAGPSIDADQVLPATTAESCNTQNVLSLTRHLMAAGPREDYAAYQERALLNHLLAIISPDHGHVTYFTPLAGHFRTYIDGTFCCVGTGIENTARFNELLYTAGPESLSVDVYVPSRATSAGLTLRQEGFVPAARTVRLTIESAPAAPRTLRLRIPRWVAGPWAWRLNGQTQPAVAGADGYLAIHRPWTGGDVVELDLPAALRTETAKDRPDVVSIFYGPVLLAGRLGKEGMPKDLAGKDAHLRLPPAEVPAILHASADPAAWLTPIDPAALSFRLHDAGPASGLELRPLYDVHHERYTVYWPRSDRPLRVAPATAQSTATDQDPRRVDRLVLGDTASEKTHDLRTAEDGTRTCVLAIIPDQALSLRIAFAPATGGRTLTLTVNGRPLPPYPITGDSVKVPLPPETLHGQQNITLRWLVSGPGTGGDITSIDLLR